MTPAAVLFAVLVSAGTVAKNPHHQSKLPPCARFCEWLDRQAETGSFYDGLPEAGDTLDADAVPEVPPGLPFGYPDSVSAVLGGISGPLSITVAPSGLYVYVIGSSKDEIMILRASTLEIVGTISISDSVAAEDASPCEQEAVSCASRVIRAHPRGGYIYVVDAADAAVSVFSIDDNVLVGRIMVGDSPSDIAFNPAGDRAFVTCRGSDQIFVLE